MNLNFFHKLIFIVFSLCTLYLTGCGSNVNQLSSNNNVTQPVIDLQGYVYKTIDRQAQNTGLLVSNIQLNDENYEAVINATVKREDNPNNPVQTDSTGFFRFSDLSVGEYNIIIDPSTSTNASNYASQIENFGIYNPNNNIQPASIKVVPVKTTVPLGKKRQFRVIMKDGSANVIPPANVNWTVEGGIGEIDANGIFLAAHAGEGKVIATYGELTAYSEVRVLGDVQESGTLQGAVTDGTIALDGIIIKIEGIASVGNSDLNGQYIIPQIPAGDYFASATQNNIVLSQQQITINAGQTTLYNFTVNPIPYISGINPTTGMVGDNITITGKYFGSNQGLTTVNFDGTQANISSWSNTEIICKVPSGAITGNIIVTRGEHSSNAISVIVISPTPTPTPIPVNKIAFASTRDGNYELYVMNPDGSNQNRLTISEGNDWTPSWSPDGSKIAFGTFRDGNEEIYVINSDGSNPIRLTNNATFDGSPSWSPDGSKILIHSLRDGNWEIYVMNTDGSNQTNLANNPAYDHDGSWSPDSSKIIFCSARDGNNNIYIMNANGSNPTRITITAADDFEPFWSPDGSKIAFQSKRDGNWEIYLMNPDGSNQTNISNNPADDLGPTWSPDGTKICFNSNRDGNWELYIMNTDGSNQNRITNNPVDDRYPCWSRN